MNNAVKVLMAILSGGKAFCRGFCESVSVRGDVEIIISGSDGSREVRHLKNLVVTTGKTILAYLLSGGSANHVTGIAFGTDGTAPVVSDTALRTWIITKTATPSYPAANQVQFSALLDTTEGNGSTYQEIGLYCTTGMFSRLAIAGLAKTVAYKIQVNWTISFQ